MRPITVSYGIQRLTAPNEARYNGAGVGLASGLSQTISLEPPRNEDSA